jgi:hypothetical protein
MADLIIFLIQTSAIFFCGMLFSEVARKNEEEARRRKEENNRM